MTNFQRDISPKPYEIVPFPKEDPQLKKPAGQHKYLADRVHGCLSLNLTVETALHVATGVVVMGKDIGENRIPLIKQMMQSDREKLLIPGSSLKGVVRSVYEAITNSTLAVVTKDKQDKNKIPKERFPCKSKDSLCPASRVFGALDWQGLIQFADAECVEVTKGVGFMPSLYSPRPDEREKYFNPPGRKFYYHAKKAIDAGKQQGIPVQQAGRQIVFTTKLRFKNLTLAELGTLLVILGQDAKNPLALKVGGGKPIGMGTMTTKVTELAKYEAMKSRYLTYNSSDEPMMGQDLDKYMQEAIKAAHENLIHAQQLQEVKEILKYPTNREAPKGLY
ncbi:MAG: RAMP superfamily CRISPR-associated protein [Oscillatoria sp. PMC 1068.18]|nr:RAMP superfamily CRISPR-associated protein [Oscillatoria sp. PMC 1076.18]MEC4988467.1 RAMP superfamily CRISPR-associated protein [Oscillatoria sp. PMC 1068.18]